MIYYFLHGFPLKEIYISPSSTWFSGANFFSSARSSIGTGVVVTVFVFPFFLFLSFSILVNMEIETEVNWSPNWNDICVIWWEVRTSRWQRTKERQKMLRDFINTFGINDKSQINSARNLYLNWVQRSHHLPFHPAYRSTFAKYKKKIKKMKRTKEREKRNEETN